MTDPTLHFDRRGVFRNTRAAAAVVSAIAATARGADYSLPAHSESREAEEDAMATRSVEYPQRRCRAGTT